MMAESGVERLRVVSLLPAATDIVHCLGLSDLLVGRSHECDSEGSASVPACTESRFGDPHQLSSREIHDANSASGAGLWEAAFGMAPQAVAAVEWGLSPYRTDPHLMRELQPDVVLTQVQTGHGALDQDEVAQRLSECVGKPVQIVHMDPQNLEDVWGDFIQVANALHEPEKGRAAVQKMRDRIRLVQGLAKGRQKRKVLCLQWLDPLFAAGAWVPELLSLAGGESVAAEAGGPSVALSAESLTKVHPEVVIFAICGCDLKQSVSEVTSAAKRGILESVEKVKVGRLAMAVVNAAKLFSRPGPTLVESLEVLAEVLYPESQPFGHKGKLWASLELLQST